MRTLERLQEMDATFRRSETTVSVSDGADGWPAGRMFSSRCRRHTAPKTDPAEARRRCRVAMKGAAAAARCFTAHASTGRTRKPIDAPWRIRHVAFLDEIDGTTETVGRAHAHLRFDAAAGECRLFDEGSSNGTSIIRGGAAIHVPARDPRGVRVQSGDEIQLGRALIRVSIDDE
jgi:hypothetical protein